MKVSEVVFACWDRSCAPPPAGKGGSRKGAAHSLRTRKRSDAKYRSQKVKELKKRAESEKNKDITHGYKKTYKGNTPVEPRVSDRAMKLTNKYGSRQG